MNKHSSDYKRRHELYIKTIFNHRFRVIYHRLEMCIDSIPSYQLQLLHSFNSENSFHILLQMNNPTRYLMIPVNPTKSDTKISVYTRVVFFFLMISNTLTWVTKGPTKLSTSTESHKPNVASSTQPPNGSYLSSYNSIKYWYQSKYQYTHHHRASGASSTSVGTIDYNRKYLKYPLQASKSLECTARDWTVDLKWQWC